MSEKNVVVAALLAVFAFTKNPFTARKRVNGRFEDGFDEVRIERARVRRERRNQDRDHAAFLKFQKENS